MFKLSVKKIREIDYVYAQKSTRIDGRVQTRSYSLGNVRNFISGLNARLCGGRVYTFSGEVCLSKIAEKIGFKECVNQHLHKDCKYSLSEYLLTLAAYHILDRGSKSGCRQWYHNSYMQHLTKLPESAFHKNNIYDYMDLFYKRRHRIFQSLRDSAIAAVGIDTSEIIFDTTSVFFRVSEFTVEDRFRRRGYSRDRRPDLLQVIIAICTNSDGFPLYYRSYPGNTSDFHAFKNFLHDFDTELKPLHGDGITWIIFDKGNTSHETIKKLDKISSSLTRGYLTYLTAVKLNSSLLNEMKHAQSCTIKDRRYMISETFTNGYGDIKRVLVVYDPKLKGTQVTKLEKKYQKLKSRLDEILKHEEDRVKRIAKMSEIIRKNRMTTVFTITDENGKIGYRENKTGKDKLFRKARTFALLTNNFTYTKTDLMQYYLGRNRIEQSIRELKHTIPIRPVHHWLKKRIKTHVFITMTGYLLLTTLKILLQKKGIDHTIDRLLSTLRSGYVDIIRWNETVTIEYPKNITDDLKNILSKLNIGTQNPFKP